jgi:predicted DNA binding CopG/RHH family protein
MKNTLNSQASRNSNNFGIMQQLTTFSKKQKNNQKATMSFQNKPTSIQQGLNLLTFDIYQDNGVG